MFGAAARVRTVGRSVKLAMSLGKIVIAPLLRCGVFALCHDGPPTGPDGLLNSAPFKMRLKLVPGNEVG